MKVLDSLIYINEKYGANLSFRSSCRAGQCGSCGVKMNGEPVLACKKEIEDKAIIEPLNFPITKDLIVDKEEVENQVNKMDLFLEKKEEYLKNNDEVENSYNTCSIPYIIPSCQCGDTKKVRSCIECHSCLSACPVINETSNFLGPYFMRYISKFEFDPRDKEDRAEESIKNGLYYCTSCGKCGEVCPKEINSFGDAIEKLRAISFEKGLGPLEAHKDIKKMIMNSGRSVENLDESFIELFSKIKLENRNLEETQRIKNDKIAEKYKTGEIAIFTGCMVDYRLQNLGFSLIDVLKKNGFEVDVPIGQVCCGSPLIRTGQIDIIDELVDKNKEALSRYDTIITLCAGCGATLKNDYPNYGVNLNIMDISEFLEDKLNKEKMKEIDLKVTYHDPCHLNRGQGIKNAPRKILNQIKGLEFIEMEKPDQCCGAGGGVRAAKPEIAFALGKKKVEMIKKLNVDAVVTICPFCQYNIQDSLNNEGLSNIKVMNILEVLKMVYAD